MNFSPKLILASTSPYRKELLGRLMIPFQCEAPAVDEETFKRENHLPQDLAELLAQEKAQDIFNKHPTSFIIGGDQVLSYNDSLLGKPLTMERAIEQLTKLSGNTHKLITSLCILGPNIKKEFTNTAIMQMRPLKENEIINYLKKDQPLNCCGAYKLESLGVALFEKIDCTDHSAIIGLPLIKLAYCLREIGFDIL